MTDVPEFSVRVARFEGPLALLLRLIEERQLEITEVSLAEVAEQYLAYLDRMRQLDLEVASQFLVIAARLLELKARALVPAPRPQEEPDPAGDGEGGAEELVRQLLAYRQFRDAAEQLRALAEAEGLHYTRFPEELQDVERAAELHGLTLGDLLRAFADVLRAAEERGPAPVEIVPEAISVAARMREVVWRLRRAGGRLAFHDLLAAGAPRRELVVTFLAILELLRRRRLLARQPEPLGPIELVLRDTGDEEP